MFMIVVYRILAQQKNMKIVNYEERIDHNFMFSSKRLRGKFSVFDHFKGQWNASDARNHT